MRDDYSTITNAYPDHEDVQGPAGFDVAQVISEFVPDARGTSSRRKTRCSPSSASRPRSATRPPRRRLGRERTHRRRPPGPLPLPGAPEEHRAGDACSAARLGSPPAWPSPRWPTTSSPTLGYSRSTRRVAWAGRTLDFTNGMSANERTGAHGQLAYGRASTSRNRRGAGALDRHRGEQPRRPDRAERGLRAVPRRGHRGASALPHRDERRAASPGSSRRRSRGTSRRSRRRRTSPAPTRRRCTTAVAADRSRASRG